MRQPVQTMAHDFGAGPEFVKGVRKMPKQKPGLSKQDYATPPEFIAAVKKRFGITRFDLDLAAVTENTVAKEFFGPPFEVEPIQTSHGGCLAHDSLAQDWSRLKGHEGQHRSVRRVYG